MLFKTWMLVTASAFFCLSGCLPPYICDLSEHPLLPPTLPMGLTRITGDGQRGHIHFQNIETIAAAADQVSEDNHGEMELAHHIIKCCPCVFCHVALPLPQCLNY